MDSVSAKLVSIGVGLPAVFVNTRGQYARDCSTLWPDCELRIDHQTRAGLLQRIAMWAGDDGEAQAYWMTLDGPCFMLWSPSFAIGNRRIEATFFGVPGGYTTRPHEYEIPDCENASTVDEALVAILEHIGRDHEVRRALGFRADLGTLWDVWLSDELGWCFGSRPLAATLPAEAQAALADITDPAEALKAIHAAVCNG